MKKEHLQRLEWARDEVLSRANELEEKRRQQEIGGIEHKILVHERLFGREKHELLGHIDSQIFETKNAIRESRETKIIVAVMLLAMFVAFASTFYAPETPTGFVVHEVNTTEITLTDCWNNTPSEKSHTTPTACEPAKALEKI